MENNSKLSLNLYKDKDKQIKFLIHFALTFRLLPETLSELFGYSIDEINNMLFYSGIGNIGLDYLINHEFPDQQKAVSFYSDLINAVRNKNKDDINALLGFLYDKKALELIKKIQNGVDVTYSDDDLLAVIRYLLKYSLGYKNTLEVFQMDPRTFQFRIFPLLDKNPELKRRYEYLADYLVIIGGRK